jgi:DNA-binding NtrC family response regulator
MFSFPNVSAQIEPVPGLRLAPHVLIVDDEPSIRRLLRRQLERWGYTVKEAVNATEAYRMMLSEPASIALIDIRMPGSHDGLWLAERIHDNWMETAIIMASGADDIRSIEISRRLGAVDFLSKPFDRELLVQALRRASLKILDLRAYD